MNLLALETSTEYLSLAVMKAGEEFTYEVNAGQSHSQIILPQLQILLEKANIKLNDLQGIAFGAGPGSFTGVRIAASVAQGLGLGTCLPVMGISTLLALAEASGESRIIACLDARMGEIYHAAYEKIDDEWITIIEPGLYKPDVVPVMQGSGWVGAGSGWKTYSEQLSLSYMDQLKEIQPYLFPTASALLRLAVPSFAKGEAKSAGYDMPIYIRNRVALKTEERMQGLRL